MLADGYGVQAFPIPPKGLPCSVTSKSEESLWLLRGQLAVKGDAGSFTLNPGDRLLIPPNTQYEVACLSEIGAYYLLGRKPG